MQKYIIFNYAPNLTGINYGIEFDFVTLSLIF